MSTLERRCSRSTCAGPAMATLTYVYAESSAVIGPLADVHEPHQYDLCADHAARLTAPRGWDVIRAPGEPLAPPPPMADDLVALAEAVREAARGTLEAGDVLRRGHLRMLRSPS